MKIALKPFVLAACFSLALFNAVPMAVHAEFPAFDGFPAFTPIPCTCSITLWSFFAPLYLFDTGTPIAGPMVYVPYATVPFMNFTPTLPAASHFGAYIPGVQACWMYIGFACIVIPSYGAMMFVSEGLPGGYGQ